MPAKFSLAEQQVPAAHALHGNRPDRLPAREPGAIRPRTWRMCGRLLTYAPNHEIPASGTKGGGHQFGQRLEGNGSLNLRGTLQRALKAQRRRRSGRMGHPDASSGRLSSVPEVFAIEVTIETGSAG